MAASIVQNVLARASEEEAEKLKSVQVDKVAELEYDLGNLYALDINDIDLNQLRTDREALISRLSRDNVQLLINKLFELPTLVVENETVVKLPAPTARLPRAKPAPKPKPLTKWEKYAKEKGITKRKKANIVWDEELKRWVPRYGYRKNLAEKEKNWVVEYSGTAPDTDDPRAKIKNKKQEAAAKNELQRLKNIQSRMQRSKAKSKISLEPTEKPTLDQINRSVYIAHTATASLGKFQPNLPDQKPVLKSGKKRQFDPVVGDLKKETSKSLDILEKLTNKKPKLDVEKAVKREMSQPAQKKLGNNKKSKTQIKKEIGRKKHVKGGSKPIAKGGGKPIAKGGGKPTSKGGKGKKSAKR
nr:EOG090X0CBY [Macrothrix elegans]